MISSSGARAGVSAAASINVPFRLLHDEIIVRGTIEGHGPFNMMLDSGADPSVVNLETARQIGLKMSSTGQQGSGTGADHNLAYDCPLPVVEVGPLRVTHLTAVALDLTKISQRLGEPIDAVLGYSLLNHRVVQFDYPARVARFLSGSPHVGPADPSTAKVSTLSFHYEDDIIADGVVVNGKKMPANVDTGCNSIFQLTPAGVIEAGLQNAPTTSHQSVGFNGAAHNRDGKIAHVAVGAISVSDQTATFFDPGTGYDHENWGIRLGNGFLKHYIVTFDFQSMKISLARP